MFRLSILLLVLLAGAPAPRASDDAPAVSLRDRLDELLDRFLGGGPSAFASYGAVVSEDAQGRIGLDVRGLVFAGDFGGLEVGDVRVDLAPLGDGRYRASFGLPARMTVRDTRGDAVMEIVAGRHDLGGVYDLDGDFWSQTHGTVSALALRSVPAPDRGFALEVADLTLSSTFAETARGKRSGPGELTLSGVAVTAFGGTARLGEVRLEFAFDNVDFGFFRELNEVLYALEVRGSRAGKRHDDRYRVAELVRMAAERAPLAGGMSMSVAVEDVVAQDPWGERLALESAALEIAAGDLDESHGTLRIAARQSGVELAVEDHAAMLIPRRAETALNLGRLPVAAVLGAIPTMTDAATETPETFRAWRETAAKRIEAAAVQGMAAAGSSLELERFVWESSALRAEGSGSLVFTGLPPGWATGRFGFSVDGLAELLRDLGEADEDGNRRAWGAVAGLTVLEAAGRPVEGTGGKRHAYDFTLDSDGRFLLNGGNVGPLLGLLGVF